MRLLFEIDKKDYDDTTKVYVRPSSRGIIIAGDKIAMEYSKKYDYYKFPGGGIEANESKIDALKREIAEEIGLTAIDESIKEYGYVHRIQKGDDGGVFIQDNYYYFLKCKDELIKQSLDEYELEEGFTLRFIEPKKAIDVNLHNTNTNVDIVILERDRRILELLIKEKYFND